MQSYWQYLGLNWYLYLPLFALLIIIAPIWKKGDYTGFGLSIIPSIFLSVHQSSVHLAIPILFRLNILRTNWYNFTRFSIYIDIDKI